MLISCEVTWSSCRTKILLKYYWLWIMVKGTNTKVLVKTMNRSGHKSHHGFESQQSHKDAKDIYERWHDHDWKGCTNACSHPSMATSEAYSCRPVTSPAWWSPYWNQLPKGPWTKDFLLSENGGPFAIKTFARWAIVRPLFMSKEHLMVNCNRVAARRSDKKYTLTITSWKRTKSKNLSRLKL